MKYIKNKSTLLLAIFFLSLSIILITKCSRPKRKHSEWRYEVHGYVIHNGKPHKAIWYTDTIEIGENYLRYENTDGTEVVIPSPYVLIDYKYNKVIKDSIPSFL
jgi:hypothetical protein